MSDYGKEYGTYKSDYGKDYRGEYGGGVTEAQRELKPYIEQEKGRAMAERSTIQPLQVIFDILSTANYASAGAADSLWSSIEKNTPVPEAAAAAIKGAWEGLTWEKKKTYSDVLRNHLDKETKAAWDKPVLNMNLFGVPIAPTGVDVAGFLGDVLLDPTTYLTFGATKGAKVAARDYATDATKVYLKNITQDIAQKIEAGGKKFNVGKYEKILAKNPREAVEYLGKIDKNMATEAAKYWKTAYKDGLIQNATGLRGKLKGQLDALQPPARALGEEFAESPAILPDLLGKLEDPRAYAQAGESSFRFLGLEGGKELISEPARAIRRASYKASDYLKSTHPGQLYTRAVDAINAGPIGKIKQAIGIRNPYQDVLRQIELSSASTAQTKAVDYARNIFNVLEPFDDETQLAARRAIEIAETAFNKDGATTIFDVFDKIDAGLLPGKGLGKIDTMETRKLAKDIWDINAEWKRSLNSLKAEGLSEGEGEIENYLYSWYKAASSSPKTGGGFKSNVQMKRKLSREEHILQEVEALKFMGIPEQRARIWIDELNQGNFSTSLKESMVARGLAQAKIEARAEMYRGLREFGVKLNTADATGQAVLDMLPEFERMGLKTFDHAAFQGYFFDKDVGRIVERVAQATSDEASQGLRSIIANYNSWWKGMALMGPLTKIRNFFDNQFTGFLNHGLPWFDVKNADMPALAGVAVALEKGDLYKTFKELGQRGQMAQRLLNKQLGGGLSVVQLAEEARKRGVISERTMGYDVADTVSKWLNKEKVSGNPLSTKFVGLDISHKLDAITENHSKFKSFMLNYQDNLKTGMRTEEALKYAALDSKKWFVDYANLTDWERKYAKAFIPFYTFVRLNLANKLQGFFMHPEMYSMLPKLEELAELDDPNYDPKLIPQYMKNLSMLPVGNTDKGFLMWNTGLSTQNVNMIPLRFTEGNVMPEIDWEGLKNDIIQSAHPIVKTIAEMIPEKGYDTFRQRDLSETAKAPYTLRFFAQSPMVMQFIDGAMRMAGVQDGLKIYLDDDGKMQINAKIARVMETNLPILKHLDNVILGGVVASESTIPGFDKALGEFSTAKSDYEGLEKFLQVIAYYTGFKYKEIDVKRLKEDLKRDIYYGAREKRAFDMKYTEKSARRREDYRRREGGVMRKVGL